MGVLSIDHVNHYPALLEARRDGSSDVSKVLASCDPRTPNALSVQLATLWTTVTLSLPELERLLRVPSRQVILAGDPGRGAIYLPTEQADRSAEVDVPARPRADAPAAEPRAAAERSARQEPLVGQVERGGHPPKRWVGRLFPRLVADDLRGIEIRARRASCSTVMPAQGAALCNSLAQEPWASSTPCRYLRCRAGRRALAGVAARLAYSAGSVDGAPPKRHDPTTSLSAARGAPRRGCPRDRSCSHPGCTALHRRQTRTARGAG